MSFIETILVHTSEGHCAIDIADREKGTNLFQNH